MPVMFATGPTISSNHKIQFSFPGDEGTCRKRITFYSRDINLSFINGNDHMWWYTPFFHHIILKIYPSSLESRMRGIRGTIRSSNTKWPTHLRLYSNRNLQNWEEAHVNQLYNTGRNQSASLQVNVPKLLLQTFQLCFCFAWRTRHLFTSHILQLRLPNNLEEWDTHQHCLNQCFLVLGVGQKLECISS